MCDFLDKVWNKNRNFCLEANTTIKSNYASSPPPTPQWLRRNLAFCRRCLTWVLILLWMRLSFYDVVLPSWGEGGGSFIPLWGILSLFCSFISLKNGRYWFQVRHITIISSISIWKILHRSKWREECIAKRISKLRKTNRSVDVIIVFDQMFKLAYEGTSVTWYIPIKPT